MQQSEWAREECLCGVVLCEVFPWLSGVELARAGAACRAWRRAASQPALWRALLARDHPAATVEGECWRQLYVDCSAGWAPVERHPLYCGGAVLHAALAPRHQATAPPHHVLAVCADTAVLAVWRGDETGWRELWREQLRARGWARVERAQWAPACARRLLLCGALALVHSWELLVLRLDAQDAYGGVLSRVRCSPGGAGCWLDGASFLSLELQALGPALAYTTVWLNSATQQAQSEHAAVRAPLLRAYNEGGAHVSHVALCGDARLVLACGVALGAWRLEARLPRVDARAGGELTERVRRARERREAAPAAAPPVPPTEREVRALCLAPASRRTLPAPLVGLASHHSGQWLCAACADGAVLRVCGDTLALLGTWRASGAAPPFTPAHYVQPGVGAAYVACPGGGYSTLVRVWRAAGGSAGRVQTRGGEAVVAALLLSYSSERVGLLVLAGDLLHEWRSRATPQCGTNYG